jgi:AmmeMemoRadiSam system protein B
MNPKRILPPAVAGTWYPSGRDDLADLVERLLDGADTRARASRGAARAVVAPHAGFAYSGAVAASAFRSAGRFRPKRVILLGPSHYFGFRGAAVPESLAALSTPLGAVPVDVEAVATLRTCPVVRADDAAFEPEHALESELPFLQRLFGNDLPTVPILLGGGATTGEAGRLAQDLAPLLDADTLVVVSSDFTHYGPRFGYVPFADRVEAKLRDLDLGAVAAIAAGDAERFAAYVEETGATICGRRAIDVLLRLPEGAVGGALVEYDTSGRMTGDWHHSVSYASIAFPPAGNAEARA